MKAMMAGFRTGATSRLQIPHMDIDQAILSGRRSPTDASEITTKTPSGSITIATLVRRS